MYLAAPVVAHDVGRGKYLRERICRATCCGLVKVELQTGHWNERDEQGGQDEDGDGGSYFMIARHYWGRFRRLVWDFEETKRRE